MSGSRGQSGSGAASVSPTKALRTALAARIPGRSGWRTQFRATKRPGRGAGSSMLLLPRDRSAVRRTVPGSCCSFNSGSRGIAAGMPAKRERISERAAVWYLSVASEASRLSGVRQRRWAYVIRSPSRSRRANAGSGAATRGPGRRGHGRVLSCARAGGGGGGLRRSCALRGRAGAGRSRRCAAPHDVASQLVGTAHDEGIGEQ
jgi:hypothetical protein